MTNVTIDIKGTATHNGGYRATVAAIDPYAARLVFQSVSVLIADSERSGRRIG